MCFSALVTITCFPKNLLVNLYGEREGHEPVRSVMPVCYQIPLGLTSAPLTSSSVPHLFMLKCLNIFVCRGSQPTELQFEITGVRKLSPTNADFFLTYQLFAYLRKGL